VAGKLKWWNGTAWTDESSGVNSPLNAPPQPPGSAFTNPGSLPAPPFSPVSSSSYVSSQTGVTFSEAIRLGFKKYATFSGRACRTEFWYFVLFNFLAVIAALILTSLDSSGVIAAISLVGYLALFIPNVSVLVRRLHDTDKSGWWYWIAIIPFGGIALLVFLCQDGAQEVNRYGRKLG
jgi:uncharacterized membrane protein YhaH (DUF805 family)